jgi:hypothetical protein
MSKRASQFKRRPRDFYPIPVAAVSPLLRHLPNGVRFDEPCAGDGAFPAPSTVARTTPPGICSTMPTMARPRLIGGQHDQELLPSVRPGRTPDLHEN